VAASFAAAGEPTFFRVVLEAAQDLRVSVQVVLA